MAHIITEVYGGVESDCEAEIMMKIRRSFLKKMYAKGFRWSDDQRVTFDESPFVYLDATFPDSVGRQLEYFISDLRIEVRFVIQSPATHSDARHFARYIENCLNEKEHYNGE